MLHCAKLGCRNIQKERIFSGFIFTPKELWQYFGCITFIGYFTKDGDEWWWWQLHLWECFIPSFFLRLLTCVNLLFQQLSHFLFPLIDVFCRAINLLFQDTKYSFGSFVVGCFLIRGVGVYYNILLGDGPCYRILFFGLLCFSRFMDKWCLWGKTSVVWRSSYRAHKCDVPLPPSATIYHHPLPAGTIWYDLPPSVTIYYSQVLRNCNHSVNIHIHAWSVK